MSYSYSSSYSRSSSSSAKSSSSFSRQYGQASSRLVNSSAMVSSTPSYSITSCSTHSPVTYVGGSQTHRYYKTRSAIVTSEPWYCQLSQTYTTRRSLPTVSTVMLGEAHVANNQECQKIVSIQSSEQEYGKITCERCRFRSQSLSLTMVPTILLHTIQG